MDAECVCERFSFNGAALPNVRQLLQDERHAILGELERRHKLLFEELDPIVRAYTTLLKPKVCNRASRITPFPPPSLPAAVNCDEPLPRPPEIDVLSDCRKDDTTPVMTMTHCLSDVSNKISSASPTPRSPALSVMRTMSGIPRSSPSNGKKDPTALRRSLASKAIAFGGGHAFLDSDHLNRLGKLVSSNTFESTFAVLILLNSLVMALELQIRGMSYGNAEFDLQYMDTSFAHALVAGLEWFFGILFTIELLLRMVGLGFYFFIRPEADDDHEHGLLEFFMLMSQKSACFSATFSRCFAFLIRIDYWSLLDFFIVSVWVTTAVLEARGSEALNTVNPTILRMMRLGKLLRMLRLVRAIRGFDPLYLLTRTLKGSASALIWSVILLILMQALMALIMCQLLMSYYKDEAKPIAQRREVYLYFGTFSRAMLTMFELTLGNWIPVSRLLLEDVSEWYLLFTLSHKCVLGFAVVSVINGVFLQKTFAVAAADDYLMMTQKEKAQRLHSRKMKRLFESADVNGDGTLCKEEFILALEDPVLKDWLAAMDIRIVDEDAFFELIACGDHLITPDELEQETARLKGAARSVDMELRFWEITKALKAQQDMLEKVLT
eukprot:TRINITY_DN12451_c0_g2_i1.p1 TRINITY_DN12451_c0_g2~~TRINITY_DN12451_c0_g2_i1.p1  ORF type:complete len:609 (-),score=109.98 TRINITY_DN12451_c0_g2_i1:563-2389(-)